MYTNLWAARASAAQVERIRYVKDCKPAIGARKITLARCHLAYTRKRSTHEKPPHHFAKFLIHPTYPRGLLWLANLS
jgi:hypothetical protein